MEPVSPQLYYLMYFNYFYPQAPHGACQSYFSSALKIYLISILRLRMEPVKMQAFLKNLCEYFYPQAPHGACRLLPSIPLHFHRFLSSGSAWSLSNVACVLVTNILISILRLRMEPVDIDWDKAHKKIISILRLRMEPVFLEIDTDMNSNNFYPQAPHGACHFWKYWAV